MTVIFVEFSAFLTQQKNWQTAFPDTHWLQYHDLPPHLRDEKFEKELDDQRYYQRRNAQAKKSHTKTRIQLYLKLGIKVDKIKSCVQIQ